MIVEIDYESELHPGQQEVWDNFILRDDVIECAVNAARRWGKTVLGKRSALHWLINDPGCVVGYLAPETNNFVAVFRWFKDQLGDVVVVKSSSMPNYIIKLNNGSTLLFYSMKNHDAVRGQGFDYCVIDEFAHGLFDNPECIDSYGATLAQARKVLYISTPKGKNVHYKKFIDCQEDLNKFHYRAKTLDNPYIPIEFVEEKRRELPDARFKQEFEGEFITGGGEVFVNLRAVCTLSAYAGQEKNRRYFAGVDWGSKNDKSVLTIIDDQGKIAGIHYSYHDNYPSIIKEFVAILGQYNLQGGFAETNGVGQAGFDYLKRQVPQMRPFVMSNKSKQEIVTLTRAKIERGLVQLPSQALEPTLFNEMADYQVKTTASGLYTYSHRPGGHDDYVDSLMFAIKAAHQPYTPTIKAPTRTIHRRLNTI